MSDRKQQQKPSSKEIKKPSPSQTTERIQDAAPGFLPLDPDSKEKHQHSPPVAMRQRAMQGMQQTSGNASVVYYLQKTDVQNVVQRTQIRDPAAREVLHNQTDPTTNRFTPGGSQGAYSISSVNINRGISNSINYQMTRSSSGVTVNVRIKFVTDWGAEPATNWLGQAYQSATNEQVATPVPAAHQPTARNICTGLVSFWNNKFVLMGRRPPTSPAPASGATPATPAAPPTPASSVGGGVASSASPAGAPAGGSSSPAPADPGEIRLPVTFVATPVFDLNADAHTTVRFNATAAAGGNNRIDSANWYANIGTYPGGINDTYAHEYGHLLGIPDEYSLSNPNAHALMHGASPSQATTSDATLDQAGRREMILSAIRPHLQSRVRAIGGEVARSLQEQQAGMSSALASALRSAWREAGVIESAASRIRQQLENAGQTQVARAVTRVLQFEALQNLSNITLAKAAVPSELSPTAIQALINGAYSSAVNSLQMSTIQLAAPGQTGGSNQMDVSVRLAPAVQGASSPLNSAAATAAQEAIGRPASRAAGAAPPIYPSNTLIGALTALAGNWDNVGQQMEGTLGNLGTEITNVMNAALAADISGEVGGSTRTLYTVLYNLVNNVSTTAMQNMLRQFLSSQITPIVNSQITDLISLIETEPSRHTRATGTGTNASPDTAPSPQLMAAARNIRTRAEQLLHPPTPAGGGQPQQNVRYSTHTLMGSNAAGQSLRTDQMQGIVTNFNDHVPDLRHEGEERFTIRATGS